VSSAGQNEQLWALNQPKSTQVLGNGTLLALDYELITPVAEVTPIGYRNAFPDTGLANLGR